MADDRDKPPSGSTRRSDRGEPNPMALASAGLELGLVTAVLCLGGWWLDRKFGTLPWFTIAGATVGMVGGIYNLWKQGSRFFKD